MNMNMKNEKTMLALVLVAALAMVSVAGVALASESDAADGEVNYLEGNVTVSSGMGDIFVYGTGSSTVTVPATVTYSGTISFGYYNQNSGVAVALGTITLSGASGVTVTYTVATGETIGAMSVSGTYTGDIVLTKGSVSIDSTYSGSIVADDATFANDKAYGYTVTLKDGKAYISGTIAAGEVTVSGTAYVDAVKESDAYDGITVAEGATLTIAEGATVETTPYSEKTYAFSFKTNDALTADDVVIDGTDATIKVSSKTVAVTGIAAGIYTYNVKNTTATSTVVTGVIIVDDGKFYVIPDYAVSTTSGTATYVADSAYTYTVVLNTNIKDGATVTAVSYVSDNEGSPVSYTSKDLLNGVLTLTFTVTGLDTKAVNDTGTLTVTITKGTGESALVYTYTANMGIKIAKLSDGKAADGTFTLKVAQNVDYQSGNAKATTTYNTNEDYTVTTTINGTLNVNGTFNVTNSYVKATGSGADAVGPYYKYTEVTTDGETDGTEALIYVSGLMKYDFVQAADSTPETNDNWMNATMYFVEATASTNSTPVFDTYYYTTLKNALAASAEVTVYGKQVISEDMTLATTLAGADETTVTVEGYIDVGIKADSKATPVVVGVTAIVIVPETTTLDLTGDIDTDDVRSFGCAYVMNGQLKFEGLSYDSYDNVYAEVFMTDATYGIYTDVITALKQAVSGDEIEIRDIVDIVYISEDIAVIDGVTLTADGHMIVVENGVTFTVSGTLSATVVAILPASSKLVAGTMVINSNDITLGLGIVNAGIITVASTFDNVTDDDKFSVDITFIGSKTYPAIINVDGKMNYSGKLTAALNDDYGGFNFNVDDNMIAAISGAKSYLTLNIAGTLNVLADVGSANGYAIANVTGTLYTDAIVGLSELYVTGTGSVAVEDLNATDNYIYVDVKLVSGTAPADVGKITNNTVITAAIADDATAFVYGDYTAKNINIYTVSSSATEDLAESTAYYVADKYNDFYLYMTQFGNADAKLDLSAPDFTSYIFIGWYNAAVSGTKITSGTIGESENSPGYASVYGYTEVKTATVTLYPETNGHWVINGNSVTSGNVQLELDGNTISFEADSGYKFDGTVTILVNDKAMPSNYQPKSGDVITVSATIVKDEKEAGMDLVTILLIIITIVIIIMAIIIALKLMRS